MIPLRLKVSDDVTRQLDGRASKLRNMRPLMAAVAGEVRRGLQDHFEKKNSEGNKNGWPSAGFWADMRRATSITSVSETAATVTVADERLNLKIYGGLVTPKRGKMLAIPMSAEAYAAGSPREMGEDLVVKRLGPALFLARAPQQAISYKRTKSGTKISRGRETFEELMYRLVPSANVPRDPNALPDEPSMQRRVDKASQEFLARTVGGAS